MLLLLVVVLPISPSSHTLQIDAFAERPKRAVCVFRFFERLHQYHGSDIMLLPLRQSMTVEAANAMVSWVWQVHSRGGLPLDLAGGQVQFLKKELAFRLDRPEIQMELSELSSPLFVHRCLMLAGQIPDNASASALPSQLMKQPCFEPMRPLRVWQPDVMPATAAPTARGSLSRQSSSGSPGSPMIGSTGPSTPGRDRSPRAAESPRTSGAERSAFEPSAASSSPSPPASHDGASTPPLRAMRSSSMSVRLTATPTASASSSPLTASKRSHGMFADEPLTAKKPLPVLERQMSTIQYEAPVYGGGMADEADILTVDVDSLISDLRAVSLDEDEPEDESGAASGSEESLTYSSSPLPPLVMRSGASPVAQPQLRASGSTSMPLPPVHAAPPPPLPRHASNPVEWPAAAAAASPPSAEASVSLAMETQFNTLPTLRMPPSYPNSDVILNVVNYLPGMELVRLAEGALTVEQASTLIRYKHENLGGIFWTFSDLQLAALSIGVSIDAFDAFSKPPFAPAVLALLAPQVASRVGCALLPNATAIHAALLELIGCATSHVCVCAPELSDATILAALVAAASRGVEVRVLVGTATPPDIPWAQVLGFSSLTFLANWTSQR